MSIRKPIPLYEVKQVRRCPVCGEASFSRAGIHPQCAQRRADAERMKHAGPIKAAAESSSGGHTA